MIGRPFQIEDVRETKLYRDGDPLAISAVHNAGLVAVLAVPMFKENELAGLHRDLQQGGADFYR